MENWLPELREETVAGKQGAMPGALAASVVLHAGIVGVLFFVGFEAEDRRQQNLDEARSITVSLVREKEPLLATSDAVTITEEAPEAVETVAEAATPDAYEETVTSSDVDPVAPPTVVIGSSLAPGVTDNGVSDRLARPGIRQMISTFMATQQGELNRQFVEDCLRYRNESALNRDCPDNVGYGVGTSQEEQAVIDRLMEDVTRTTDDARRSRKLQRDSLPLLAIMEAGGPAAEQAGIRLQLNAEYFAFLNGNTDRGILASNQLQGFPNSYGASFTARPYQFVCAKRPCIYRYTGFDAREMGNYVEQPATFPKRAPLFKPSRQ